MCGKYGPYIEFPGGKPYRPGVDGPDEIGTTEVSVAPVTETPRHGIPSDGRYDRTYGGVTAGPRDITSSDSPDAI